MVNQQTHKKILQGLFFLALISPLLVDRRLFFPYVTGMAMYFRVVVELLFVLWVIFILLYSEYRPRFNILIGSITFYLLALSVATILSTNPYLSFWGDAERMMGLFGYLHFFILFIIGTTLFKDRKELRRLIIVFVGISLAMCFYGILQRFGLSNLKPGATRILGTLGNAGHLAAYLIFGLFFSVYLALSEREKGWKLAYSGAAVIHLIALIMTGTRGAYLGVGIGFLFGIIIYIINLKERKDIKKKILGAILVLFIIYAFLFVNQRKDWVKNNLYLNRLTYFSLSDVTMRARLLSWKWGIQGFRDKPILGYGLERFAIPYNKYFTAEYYDLAPGDTYFDRAHNIVIELLATTGIIGFISYFSVLIVAGYFLVKKYKEENDSLAVGVIGGLMIAYVVQNLFIFDLLPAMLGFMTMLVLINNSYANNLNKEMVDKPLKTEFIIPIFIILAFSLFYSYKNLIIAPYKSLKDNALGQLYMEGNYNYELGMRFLKSSVSRSTPLDLDIRSAAANTIFNYYMKGGSERKEKKDDLDFTIKLYEKNLKKLPGDVYYNYKIGEIMNYRFSVDLDEKYISEAKRYIDKAISLSLNRIEIYYSRATNQLMAGELEDAVKTAEYAVNLNDKYGEARWELTKVYYLTNKYDKARESLIKMVEMNYKISEESMRRLGGLFDVEHKIEDQIIFFELMAKNGTSDYLIPSTLANYYLEKGDKTKAIEYARMSAEINPEVKEKVEKFIKSISEK